MRQTSSEAINRTPAPRTVRDSNFELLRMLAMVMIIAHHYVVNSGLQGMFDLRNVTGNLVFLQVLGSGGMAGVNCFTLLTGYFMVRGKWRITKVLRLVLEIWFYRIVLNLLLYLCGYAEYFTWQYLFHTAFSFVYNVNEGYVSSMLVMYLLIPYLNKLAASLNRRQFFWLLGILGTVYSIIPTFAFRPTWHYVPWLCIVYLTGAYIRLFPSRLLGSLRAGAIGVIVSAALVVGSILAVDALSARLGDSNAYYMCDRASKTFTFMLSVSLFLLFQNLTVRPSRLINRIAASTFGVVLIHGNSDVMRRLIWVDLFRNTAYYNSPYLPLHALIAIVSVYAVCTLLDMLRIRWIEAPLFARIDAREATMQAWIRQKTDWLLRKLHLDETRS